MNLVIVDSECQMLYEKKEDIENLLGTSASVLYPDISGEFIENGCRIRHPEDSQEAWRYVLLTSFSGGVKAYHKMMFQNNPDIRQWVVSIVDVNRQSYQKQFLHQIDMIMADVKIPYKVIFDSSETLKDTAEECKRVLNTERVWLLAAKDQKLLKEAADLMAERKKGWKFLLSDCLCQEQADAADAVMLLGRTEEDFDFEPVSYGMNKLWIWVQQDPEVLCTQESENQLQLITQTLRERGWEFFADMKNICSGSLENEKRCLRWQRKEISAATLRADGNFVMWDRYGLPAAGDSYSDENVKAFFENTCCFGHIADSF